MTLSTTFACNASPDKYKKGKNNVYIRQGIYTQVVYTVVSYTSM